MSEIVILLLVAAVIFLVIKSLPDLKPEEEEEVEPESPPERIDPGASPCELRPITSVHLPLREEHTMIVARTGHGKSFLLKALIGEDMPQIAAGKASAVVLDSKGTLIRDLLKARICCTERTIVIDPEDYPNVFSLNLLGINLVKDAPPEMRREYSRASLDMLEYCLLARGLDTTERQRDLLSYAFKLCLVVPDATLNTLLDILSNGGKDRYQRYIDTLGGSVTEFFNDKISGFDGKEFRDAKRELSRRIYGLLEDDFFSTMFADPSPAFDILNAINSGSLILVNTSRKSLGVEYSSFLGRVIVAQMNMASIRREALSKEEKIPCYFYIDEADDYADEQYSEILKKARSANIGLIVAHQNLSKIPPMVLKDLRSETATKIFGFIEDDAIKPFMRAVGAEEATKTGQLQMSKGEFWVVSKEPVYAWLNETYIQLDDGSWVYDQKYLERPNRTAVATLDANGVYLPPKPYAQPSWNTSNKRVIDDVRGRFNQYFEHSTKRDRQIVMDRVRETYCVPIREAALSQVPPPAKDENPEINDPTIAKQRPP